MAISELSRILAPGSNRDLTKIQCTDVAVKGSLRERRPGNWELIVQLRRDAATGKPKQLSRSHVGTKREVHRAVAALVAQVAEGKISSSSTSLNELLARWLNQVDNRPGVSTNRESAARA